MVLTGSGQLAFSQINIELGRSGNATISIDTAENGGYGSINPYSISQPSNGDPARVSEWYNYNHSASPPPPPCSGNLGDPCIDGGTACCQGSCCAGTCSEFAC